MKLYDIIWVDYFWGFVGYWEIFYFVEIVMNGCWVLVLGYEMFEVVWVVFGSLFIIVEDFGVIIFDVEKLCDDFGFFGMVVL